MCQVFVTELSFAVGLHGGKQKSGKRKTEINVR